jgi:hypothetical protein
MGNAAKVPSEEYLAFAETFLAGHPDVSSGAMFGMRCLKTGGKAFAGGFDGGLVVKLADADYEEAAALGDTRPFDPSGGGRPMRAWLVLGASLRDDWERFAEAAFRALHA